MAERNNITEARLLIIAVTNRSALIAAFAIQLCTKLITDLVGNVPHAQLTIRLELVFMRNRSAGIA